MGRNFAASFCTFHLKQPTPMEPQPTTTAARGLSAALRRGMASLGSRLRAMHTRLQHLLHGDEWL